MQVESQKVKRIIPLQVAGLQLSVLLGQADEAQALVRVQTSLERHGWLQGVEPRALVRAGGVA